MKSKTIHQYDYRKRNMKVYAINEGVGLGIYLRSDDGNSYFVVSHRRNGLLWKTLRNGMPIGELRKIRPSFNRKRQKMYELVRPIRDAVDFLQPYYCGLSTQSARKELS